MTKPLRPLLRWLEAPSGRFSWRWSLLGLLGAVSLFAAERGLERWRSGVLTVPEACWIWVDDPTVTEADERPPDDPRSSAPIAFFAAKNLELSSEDATALAEGDAQATLDIAADESYVVYLNDRWVGSNSLSQGTDLDHYEVSRWLVAGANRLVVELRSQRGVGGVLVGLRLRQGETETTLTASDASWRTYRRFHPDLFVRGKEPPGGEVPRVWAHPPTGRWRLTKTPAPRPIPFVGPRPKTSSPRIGPTRMRGLWGQDWFSLNRGRRRLPALGPKVLFDWGTEVTGYLFFDLPNTDHPPALVWFGDEPPDPFERSPDEVLVFMPGYDQHRTIHPRTFRYALFIGVQPQRTIQVRRLEEPLASALAPPAPTEGVFGIPPANRYTPAEELVWGRLRETTGRRPPPR